MIAPEHHQHIRKRISVHKEKFPSTKRWKRNLDWLVTCMGIVMVFAILPQAIQIWTSKNASGVSVFTWAYFTLYGMVMLTYGFAHKARPIIITYLATFTVYLSITIGAIIYQ